MNKPDHLELTKTVLKQEIENKQEYINNVYSELGMLRTKIIMLEDHSKNETLLLEQMINNYESLSAKNPETKTE